MSDKARLLEELIKLSEEAGLYDDESTPEEIVATIKQVRKEMAEERLKMSDPSAIIKTTKGK